MRRCHLSCKLVNTGWISTFARAPSSDDDHYDNEHYHDDCYGDIDYGENDDDYDGNEVEDYEKRPAIDDGLGRECQRGETVTSSNLEPERFCSWNI